MKNIKAKVLDEIIDVLDQEDGKRLMKHPKLMAAKVTIAKPITKPEMEDEIEGENESLDEEMMGALEGIGGIEDLENLSTEKKEKILKMLMK